jgi:hypothetical protein
MYLPPNYLGTTLSEFEAISVSWCCGFALISMLGMGIWACGKAVLKYTKKY